MKMKMKNVFALYFLLTTLLVTASPNQQDGDFKQKLSNAVEKSKETVEKIKKGGVKEAVEMAKNVATKAEKTLAEGAKREVGTVMDTSKTLGGDVKRNSTIKLEQTKEKLSNAVGTAEEMVEKTVEKAKHAINKDEDDSEPDRPFGNGFLLLESMGLYMEIIHLLGISTAYGICVWITFMSSKVLAKALPRRQFALAQSKIYPVYFKAMGYSVGVALLGHFLSQRRNSSSSMSVAMGTPETYECFNLLSSLLVILTNLCYLGPQASKVEKVRWEKEEGGGKHGGATKPSSRLIDSAVVSEPDPPPEATQKGSGGSPSKTEELSETLKKLNWCSSFLNALTLMSLTWHIVYMGHRLHTHNNLVS